MNTTKTPNKKSPKLVVVKGKNKTAPPPRPCKPIYSM
jgi:hypothetical protein